MPKRKHRSNNKCQFSCILSDSTNFSLINFGLIQLSPNAHPIDPLDIKLPTFHPISLILPAILLIELVSHDLIPERVILSVLHITGREILLEEGPHHDHHEVLVGVVLL